ncbi:MAG: hypothetical protein ACI31R_02605 [Bacilli bacterium]
MDKKDVILPFYEGNFEYTAFLLSIIYDFLPSDLELMSKESINAAKMGAISNILLAIKEDIVEEEPNHEFKSKILISELEKVVDAIATKEDNGYKINGVLFKDAASLVAEIRNRIAHGNYTLDLGHNRVILKRDGEDIKININNLQLFIMIAVKNYNIKVSPEEYERDILIFRKLEKNRTNPITSDEELISVLKDFNKITFTLKPKKGNLINPYVVEIMQSIIRKYKKVQDNKILYEFQKEIKEDYDFKWELTKIKKYDELKELASQIVNILPTDIRYEDQIRSIGFQVQRYMDSEYDSLGPITGNLKNLILLEEMSDLGTNDIKTLFFNLGSRYSDFSVDYDMLASSLMGMFNSMFAYANEDIYEKEDFDYSELDLSLLEVDTLKIDTLELDCVSGKISTNSKRQGKVKKLIAMTQDSLSKVDKNNTGAITSLNKRLGELVNEDTALDSVLNTLDAEKNRILSEYNLNADKRKNKTIIERLRNSIAHGNYMVKINDSYESAVIEFEDFHKDEVKLKARIKLIDFVRLMDLNVKVIENFIYEKTKSK